MTPAPANQALTLTSVTSCQPLPGRPTTFDAATFDFRPRAGVARGHPAPGRGFDSATSWDDHFADTPPLAPPRLVRQTATYHG